jgi:hypothetical protein
MVAKMTYQTSTSKGISQLNHAIELSAGSIFRTRIGLPSNIVSQNSIPFLFIPEITCKHWMKSFGGYKNRSVLQRENEREQ